MFDPLRNRTTRRQALATTAPAVVADLTSEDLPCPWCRAETHEGDVRCASCGRRFG